MKTIFLALLFGWGCYNLVRVLLAPGNAVEVFADSKAEVPVAAAFSAYMKVREFYLDLSPGHRKYEIIGGPAPEDMVIDIWETAGFQFVKHKYRIAELVPDARMRLVSPQSEVRVLGVFRGISRSEAEFRFQPDGDDRTLLSLTIRIIFPNKIRAFLARMFFTEAIWRRHARQEMAALARIIEQRYAAAAA